MSYLNIIDEIRSYRKVCDRAIQKLKNLLRKHRQPTQLFWSDFYNSNDDESSDDESTEIDESTEENDDEICRKVIREINDDDDESQVEADLDFLRDTIDEANGKKKFKPSHTPPNSPVLTSRSSNLSWSPINTPPPASSSSQLVHPPTLTPLLPLQPPPAPPPPTVSQLPSSGPPLLPLPPSTVSNVFHNIRPINVYNVNFNINPDNNVSDNDETDNDSTDHDSDESDHDSDAIVGFAKFFADYFFFVILMFLYIL
jgi:hypothetical protein